MAETKAKCSNKECKSDAVDFCPIIGKDIEFKRFCKLHLKDAEKVINDTLIKINLR